MRTEEFFPQEDDLQQVMIAAGLHLKLFYENSVYRRFSSEFSSHGIHLNDLGSYLERVTKAYKVTRDIVGEQRADFLFMAFKGMDCYLEPYLCENIDKFSFEQTFEYIALIYYQFVAEKELGVRIEKAQK